MDMQHLTAERDVKDEQNKLDEEATYRYIKFGSHIQQHVNHCFIAFHTSVHQRRQTLKNMQCQYEI